MGADVTDDNARSANRRREKAADPQEEIVSHLSVTKLHGWPLELISLRRTMTQLRVAGKGGASGTNSVCNSDREPSIGLETESMPVAALGRNGYETAAYVVDGRSVDHTRDIAVEKGARVMGYSGNPDHLPRARGSTEALFIEGAASKSVFFCAGDAWNRRTKSGSHASRKKTTRWIEARSIARRVNLRPIDGSELDCCSSSLHSKRSMHEALAETFFVPKRLTPR
jgi:hypothetical protein